MEKKEFSIDIHAPKEKVWDVLFSDRTYSKWTSVFAEGSSVTTDGWKKGTQVQFHDGKGSGMISKIADNVPNEYMSIEHLGMIKDGKEDYDSPEIKSWAGAKENYTLKSSNGDTKLVVDIDLADEWKDYMNNTWPKALEKVKELAEN